MAFCSRCGASIDQSANFCPSCRTPVGAPPVPAPVAQPEGGSVPPARQGSGALKVVLIILAVVVALGVLATASAIFIGYRFARSTRVMKHGQRAIIETPVGTIEANAGGSEGADKACASYYPQARGARHVGSVKFGGLSAAVCESDDPPEKVADYFRSRISEANLVVSDRGKHVISGRADGSRITVVIEERASGSKITVTRFGR